MDDPVTKKNLRPASNFLKELRQLIVMTDAEVIDFAHIIVAYQNLKTELPLQASASAHLESALVSLEAYKQCLLQMEEDSTRRD
jgi:hypothetical protein